MTRNLLFHVYPIKRSLWSWHLDQLRRFWPVFNGKKLVVVATDARTEPLAAVKRRLAGLDARLLETRNDPRLWQTRSFLSGLALLESRAQDAVTFYAHGKGVTYAGQDRLSIQAWCAAMYFMNLSAPGLIDRLLREHSSAGCFRHQMRHGGSGWHYSGAFFWFRNAAIFSRDWRDIQDGPFGVEGYLGRHIPLRDSCSLTPPRRFSRLYDGCVTLVECRRWLARLAGRETRKASPYPARGRNRLRQTAVRVIRAG